MRAFIESVWSVVNWLVGERGPVAIVATSNSCTDCLDSSEIIHDRTVTDCHLVYRACMDDLTTERSFGVHCDVIGLYHVIR